MTGHELARQLLALPDVDVVFNSAEDWTGSIQLAQHDLDENEISLGWLPR